MSFVSENAAWTWRKSLLLLAAWFAVALAVSRFGYVETAFRLPFLIPATIWSLIGGGVALWFASPAFRGWATRSDLRPAVLYHLVRLGFGLAFLVLGATGELNQHFASVAGWGDVAAGALALPVALFGWRSRGLVLAWNAFGLADILLVMATATRILFAGQSETMAPFTELPFAVLPLFVVPLVVLTHFLVFARGGRLPAPSQRAVAAASRTMAS